MATRRGIRACVLLVVLALESMSQTVIENVSVGDF